MRKARHLLCEMPVRKGCELVRAYEKDQIVVRFRRSHAAQCVNRIRWPVSQQLSIAYLICPIIACRELCHLEAMLCSGYHAITLVGRGAGDQPHKPFQPQPVPGFLRGRQVPVMRRVERAADDTSARAGQESSALALTVASGN